MRRVLIVAATCAAASASLAQSGPSGGYYPWTLSYPSIGYDFGGITLPTDVAGGSKGKGTINAQGVYANGELMLGGSFGANMAPARPLIRGGVFSRTPTLHEFLTGTDENGAFLAARPSCADLSDSAGSCSADATNASNITSGTLDPARLPQYATNAAVKAISLTGKSAGYAIFRQGFSSAGDGGQMTYYLSTSACSISGGNDATQIAPNSGTGCWIAENRTAYDARIFGIVEGDSGAGSATNSAALTKMFALAAGPEIVFPAGVYRIACTTAQQIPSSTIYYHYLAASGVYLRGQGRERTKLKFDAGCLFNGNVFLWRSLATAPTPRGGVADLTIDLGAPQTPAVRAAILAANANNHDIDSFVVERAGVIHGTTRMHLVSGVAAGGKTLKGFRVSKSYLQLTSLPREATITGASWSGGSATFNVSADLRDALSANLYVFVRNATPSAWNGTWRVTAITASQITVAMTSDPGAYSSGGLAQAYVDNYCIATSLPGVTGYIPDSVVEDTECDGSGVQLDGERPKFVRNNVHHYNFGGAIYLPFSVSALAGVSNASWAGGVGTLTVGSDITSVLEVGKLAAINGVTPSAWNGFWKVASKSANTITVEMPTNPGAYASGGYVMRGEPSTRACVVSDNVFHDTEYTADVNNTEPGGAENHCVDSIFSNNIIYNIGSSGIVNFSDKATYVGNVFRNVGAGVPAWTQRTSAINLTKIFVGNRPPERSAHVTVMGNTLEPGPDTGPGLFIGPDTSDSAAFAVDGGGNNLGSVGQSDGLLQVEHRVSRVAPGVVSYARRASSLHTAVSSLSFAPLDMGSFKSWKLTCENIYPTSADKPAIRLSKDGGATWLTAGSYSTAGTRADGATLTSLTASAQTSIPVSDVAWRSDNSRQQRFEATFGDLSAAGSKMIWFDAFYRENASGNMQWTRGGGWWTADSDAINGVQVVMQSNPGVATFKGTCTLKGE